MNPLSPDAELNLVEREGIFVAGRGVKLHYRTHRVEGAPFRAAVAVVESPDERGRLYAELVRLLAPGGYALYGCAHQEHRRVPGQNGFLEEWNNLYQELDAFIALVQAHEPDAPLFLAGAQVAGQLVMTYALHHPEKLHGIIAYQPRMHRSTSRRSLVSLTKALSRIWPAFTPAGTLDPVPESGNAAAEKLTGDFRKDLLSPQVATTGATASEISVPMLIVDVDGETPSTRAPDPGGSPDSPSARPSLLEVGPWLDRILKEAGD